eukprot:TRINITY_DN56978_c0_g1_i1.p1 TRINITY_DN56978_c0_g1~~TRINITY_DN56978_c0_g1_i1.p1  ORF type:complete len:330 (+),score=69.26 TRINITY_DN56978_c0_g1_i1:158-1147(+)
MCIRDRVASATLPFHSLTGKSQTVELSTIGSGEDSTPATITFAVKSSLIVPNRAPVPRPVTSAENPAYAQLVTRLQMSLEDFPPGSAERAELQKNFISQTSSALGIPVEELTVASLAAGSVMVEWRMAPQNRDVKQLVTLYKEMLASRDPTLVAGPVMSRADTAFVPTVRFETRKSEQKRIKAELAQSKLNAAKAIASAEQVGRLQAELEQQASALQLAPIWYTLMTPGSTVVPLSSFKQLVCQEWGHEQNQAALAGVLESGLELGGFTERYLGAIRGACSGSGFAAVSYTHLRAHETPEHLVCRLLLEKKKIIPKSHLPQQTKLLNNT